MPKEDCSHPSGQLGEGEKRSPQYQWLLDMLQGESEELAVINAEGRLDLGHYVFIVRKLKQATGEGRIELIGAMGEIIKDAERHPLAAADLLHLVGARMLNTPQLDRIVGELARTEIALHEVLRPQIERYEIYRKASEGSSFVPAS